MQHTAGPSVALAAIGFLSPAVHQERPRHAYLRPPGIPQQQASGVPTSRHSLPPPCSSCMVASTAAAAPWPISSRSSTAAPAAAQATASGVFCVVRVTDSTRCMRRRSPAAAEAVLCHSLSHSLSPQPGSMNQCDGNISKGNLSNIVTPAWHLCHGTWRRVTIGCSSPAASTTAVAGHS